MHFTHTCITESAMFLSKLPTKVMQMLIYDDRILNVHVAVINCMYAYNKLRVQKQIFMKCDMEDFN
jgi:hypothetical protein